MVDGWEGENLAALAEQLKLPWNFIFGGRNWICKSISIIVGARNFRDSSTIIIVMDGCLRYGLCRVKLNLCSLS